MRELAVGSSGATVKEEEIRMKSTENGKSENGKENGKGKEVATVDNGKLKKKTHTHILLPKRSPLLIKIRSPRI